MNLFAREFVELARKHLTPTGILALWVPLPSFDGDFWMIARNVTDTFPHTLAWAEPHSPIMGFLLLGSNAPLDLDPAVITQRMVERKRLRLNPWLTPDLFHPRRVITDERLRQNAARYPNVTDDWPYTEFPLPAFLDGAPLRFDSEFAFR